MLRQLARISSACCAIVALTVVLSAQPATKPASFVGSTRDQVVEKLGEPKSNLKAGAREILFFQHVKLTLRNGVVIEAEEIADEPPPKHAVDATPPAAAGASGATAPAAQPVSQPAATTSAPAAATTDANAAQPARSATPDTTVTPPKPTPPPEPALEIKSIRSGTAAKSAMRPSAPATSSAPAPANVTPAVATPAPKPAPVASTEPVKPTPPAAAPSEAKAVTAAPAAMADEQKSPPEEEVSTPETAPEKPKVDPKKKLSLRQRWRLRRDAETEEDSVELFSVQSYVMAAIIMIGGAAFLWWQWMQRKLALAATAVSQTPFEDSGPVDAAGQFTPEVIAKLSARKFERLVASYYAKTGVVAERTHAAPGAAVQIRIFWKGEPKPFAGVQCHSNPPLLIGAKPLQELFDALTAADIRRGYVVTNGKFNVEARDYAEEKHFTLLPGDIFLEKINALPPAVRAELLKETNAPDEAPPPAAAPAVIG